MAFHEIVAILLFRIGTEAKALWGTPSVAFHETVAILKRDEHQTTAPLASPLAWL